MERKIRDKTFRDLAMSMCEVYEGVYEVDVCRDKLYVWRESPGEVVIPEEGRSYQAHVKRISGKFIHPGYTQEFETWMSEASIRFDFANGNRTRALEMPVYKRSSHSSWFLIQMHLIEMSPDELRIMLLIRDVHEKRQEELHRQNTIMEALKLMRAVSSVYDVLISANLTQNSYYMIGYDRLLNHSAPEYGNYEELIDTGAGTVPEEQRQKFLDSFSREKLLQAYEEGKPSVYLEHQQYSDKGEPHWMSTHVMFTENPYNDDVLQITLSRCIDQRKEQEEKNRKVLTDALSLSEQANSAKTDFLSRMSHDIRTPMNAIVGMTAIARANIDDPEKLKDCPAKIDMSSGYLLNLINDILDLSKIESGKVSALMEPFDFREMMHGIASIIEQQALEKKQSFELHIAEDIEQHYIGDELRLRQIFMNLLNNAHKYTREGGAFSLWAELVQTTDTIAQFKFQVIDNGIGITQNFIHQIFDPFSQEVHSDRRSGSGLGLAITQNLVHLMNGFIRVESEYKKGSCFTVELPLKRIRQDKKGMEPDRCPIHPSGCTTDISAVSFSGEKILLVEDNELNQEIAAAILEMKNLTVKVASNGKEGVKKFSESAPGEYAMILMDIQMPVMNGYDAAEAIRRMDREDAKTVPIYAMTADAFSSDVAKALASGMNGHLAKPIDLEHLSDILYKELGEK